MRKLACHLPPRRKILVRQFHPTEKILGSYAFNDTLEVEVYPFRSCLITVSIQGIEGVNNEIGVIGCDYDLLKDLPDQPVELVLRGMSGSTANIMLHSPNRSFSEVIIDNQPMDFEQFQNGDLKIEFSGEPLLEPWHRKIAPLTHAIFRKMQMPYMRSLVLRPQIIV